MKRFVNKKRILRTREEVSKMFFKLSRQAVEKNKASYWDEKFYNSLDLNLEGKAAGEILKKDFTVGKCHFYALLLALAMPNSTLCKGQLHALDRNVEDRYVEPFEHSWVEHGNYVYDTTVKHVFLKDYYVKTFQAEALEKHSNIELYGEKLVKLGLEAVRWRPSLEEKLVMFDRFNNLTEEEFLAKVRDMNKEPKLKIKQ